MRIRFFCPGCGTEVSESLIGNLCQVCHKKIKKSEVNFSFFGVRNEASRWLWMPVDYTCPCGIYVHPSRRNPAAIHIDDCPYGKGYDGRS